MSTPPPTLLPPPADWLPERERLLREKEQLAAENRVLELKVQKLQRMLWDRKSERRPPDDKQSVLFEEPAGAKSEAVATSPAPTRKPTAAPRPSKGPKPLDPALPREVIQVPAPDLKELICPVTKEPRKAGFVEQIEVLARRAPAYYVKVYERTVFVSPAKTAPVYAPWPADILPRSRVHASVVGHIAAAHYSEHLPYYAVNGIVRPMPGVGLCRLARVGRAWSGRAWRHSKRCRRYANRRIVAPYEIQARPRK